MPNVRIYARVSGCPELCLGTIYSYPDDLALAAFYLEVAQRYVEQARLKQEEDGDGAA